jgi:hypothetical protein
VTTASPTKSKPAAANTGQAIRALATTTSKAASRAAKKNPKRTYRRWQVLVAGALVAMGISIWGFAGRAASLASETVADYAAATRVETIGGDLVQAQIKATRGAPDQSANSGYGDSLTRADEAVTKLTAAATDGDTWPTELNSTLSVYERTLAIAANKQSDEVVPALETASYHLDSVVRMTSERSESLQYTAGRYSSLINGLLVAAGVIGWLVVGALVGASIWAAIASHRVINPGLAVSLIAAITLASWASAGAATWASAEASRSTGHVVAQARTNLSRGLLTDYQVLRSTPLYPDETLLQADNYFDQSIWVAPRESQATDLMDSHQATADALTSGNWDAAAAELSVLDEYVDVLVKELDADIEASLAPNSYAAAFVSSMNSLAAVAVLVAIAGAAAGAYGLQRRLRDFL